ncbi:MAG: AAA family ATPase [Candidatus Scalindua sp.]
MKENRLIIRKLIRKPSNHTSDTLSFEPGVNVLVGPPDTGKTQWLKILDFLLGNDSKVEDAISEEVFEKYNSAQVSLTVGTQDIIVERRWKEPGVKTKIFVNGDPMSESGFGQHLLSLLGLPILHYPKGDPYRAHSSWPELSWRSLLRHIYRQQRFWSDFADKQPDVEQHACLTQFLGIAKDLFSDEYGNLVIKSKKIEELKSKKENFISMLQEVSSEIIDDEELGVALTPQSIESACQRLKTQVNELEKKRDSVLKNLINDATSSSQDIPEKGIVEKLGENLARLQTEQEKVQISHNKTIVRLEEMKELQRLITEEQNKIERVINAGSVLSPIKITHCPACDNQLEKMELNSTRCHLCHRPIEGKNKDDGVAEKRFDYERGQLGDERKELEELIDTLTDDQKQLETELSRLAEKIQDVEFKLRPIRTVASAIIPPELITLDLDIGRLEERHKLLQRIGASLNQREELSAEITKIEGEVAKLTADVSIQKSKINYEDAGDILIDGMNTYLNKIHKTKPRLWTHSRLAVELRKKDFKFFVGDRNWKSKIGGTSTLFFLISYHYGLMCLTPKDNCNYPGLLILDFPAELEDGSTVKDKENFVLEPFVSLLQKKEMKGTQVIAAGSAFEELEGANRIELTHIWK